MLKSEEGFMESFLRAAVVILQWDWWKIYDPTGSNEFHFFNRLFIY